MNENAYAGWGESDFSYIKVYKFMSSQLHLRGNELLLYALIFGFSQQGKLFRGSLSYLCSMINASRPTVISALNSLVQKNLIVKISYDDGGVRRVIYRIPDATEIVKPDEVEAKALLESSGGQ